MGRFDDRNVIVTGAAQGIGRAIVEAFVEDGARVFAADVRAEGLEDVRTSTDPARERTHVVDLSDFEAARSLGVEEDTVKEVTGARKTSYGALLLAAYQGRPAEALPLIATVTS